MSTAVEPRRGRHAKGTAKQPAPASEGTGARLGDSRLANWRSSWRIALRMARRDLRLHKGRSAIVALMVGVPMLALSWLATMGTMTIIGSQPSVDKLMGAAAALVTGPDASHLLQTGSEQSIAALYEDTPGEDGQSLPVAARPVPGFVTEGSAADNAEAIAALTGGTATPLAEPSVRVRIGDRNVLMQLLAVDGSTVDLGDKVQLLSGRWPSGPTEALVSEPGIRKGLPSAGTVELITLDGTAPVTIVGTGTGVTSWGQLPHLISGEPLGGAGVEDPMDRQWLITGTDMPFAKVAQLGAFGLQVQSAELMTDPVSRDQLPPEVRESVGGAEVGPENTLFFVTVAIILAIVIALLVAPAFAVSAARQRRTLALAASNGATTRQLRRTVLAQALILGVLAAVVGALLGAGLAAGMAWRRSRTATEVFLPIVDIPWSIIAGLALIAIVASVTAALFPARRLGRLDIMGVLKGQSVSASPSKVVPVVGLVLMAAGGAAVLVGARRLSGGDYFVALGSIPLVVGALFLIPIALTAVGRLSSGLPVPLRMATRDAARQRSRSVPTVAAVMGGVAALTIGLISGASDNAENQATYLPQTVLGQGTLFAYDEVDLDPALAVVRGVLPQADIAPMVTLAAPMGPVVGEQAFTILTTSECSAEKAMYDREFNEAQQADFEAAPDPSTFSFDLPPCPVVGGPTGWDGSLVAMPAAEIIARFELSGPPAQAVREGAAVALDSSRLSGDTITAWAGTYEFNDSTGEPVNIAVTGERSLALITVSAAEHRTGALPSHVAAIVPLEIAREQKKWEETQTTHLVNPAAGDEITEEDERLIGERLDSADFSVERGFLDELTLFFSILVAAVAFILLVIILTSTALSMAEQRRDDSTLAAVGATRGTRRATAASQGFTAAAIGAVLGLVVGILPGIAFAYALTRSFPQGISFDSDGSPVASEVVGPFVAIPYGFLAVIVVGVPLLAALISALAVRRAPTVTRRPG